MRKVHLVSATEPLIFDMALAIREKGYEVCVSGKGLTEEVISQLREVGCTCYGDGWFPEKLTKETLTVVLGATVKKDNPELIRAKELGLLIQSVPEFIFERTKTKTRVVVAGNKGKTSVLSMMAYALQYKNRVFDYALSSKIDLLPSRISLGYEARIALIEGNEHITSTLDKRFQLEFYRPHIAVLTNLLWTDEKDHNTQEEYLNTYRDFVASIEREGKLIYFSNDKDAERLSQEIREDMTSMPYEEHEVIMKDGKPELQTRYGDFPVYIPDEFFLTNLNGARLACRQLGVKDADFYKAISEYSLSLQA